MRDISDAIEEYRTYAILQVKESHEGNYKMANKHYAAISRIYRRLSLDRQYAERILARLLRDSDYAVQLWAAAHSLALGLHKEDAVSKLRQISTMSADEAPRLEAEMTLQAWIDKGSLIF